MKEVKFLESLIEFFQKFPGVGKKTATRYAYYVAEKFTDEDIETAIKAFKETHENVKHCNCCNMLTNQDVCEICSDPLRDDSQVLVVKDTKDILSIEKAKTYNGKYYVLGGLISILDGIGPDELQIDKLETITKNPNCKEVILATSFTPAGETTALYLEKVLSRDNLKISRIGYGLPAGGDIEYADERTIGRALESRR